MKLTSEFESLYHALTYHVHHLIQTERATWRTLSDALYEHSDALDFDLPEQFEDALIDQDHDDYLELFNEEHGLFKSILGNIAPANYSNLEKHYLKWMLSHPHVGLFLSPNTQSKLAESLKDIDRSVFEGHFVNVNKPLSSFDDEDRAHLNRIIEAIENQMAMTYCYMDDEGNKYVGDSIPLYIEYNFQTDFVYLVHMPHHADKPVKGLLHRFESLEVTSGLSHVENIDSILAQWRVPSETLVIQISKNSPQLRKVLVELSMFERTILPDHDQYVIQLPIYPQEEAELKSKIFSLVPHIKVLAPNAFIKSLNTAFKNALNNL